MQTPHTNNRLQAYWPQVSVYIKQKWPLFREIDLAAIDGDFDQFLILLKQYYGGFPKTEAVARDVIRRHLDELESEQFTKRK